MLIPFQQLSPDTLTSVLDSIITREGTDYGERELSLIDKRQQLLRQLQNGDVVLLFDESDQSINVMAAPELAKHPSPL